VPVPADYALLEGLDPFHLMDVESARLDAYFSHLDAVGTPHDWAAPTRCSAWSVRDMLGHLAAIEEYNQACLDDRVSALFEKARSEGAGGPDGFNAWGVRVRAGVPTGELLARWRADNADYRRRMRERGRDGTLDTTVGQYPVFLQAFYLAVEYATHADDMGVPVDGSEAAGRARWRALFTRFALGEQDRPVTLVPGDGVWEVLAGADVAELSDAELAEAGVRRLPRDHPLPESLREVLVCCA
jgi:uncharacterized protein (TIGR03083 family)